MPEHVRPNRSESGALAGVPERRLDGRSGKWAAILLAEHEGGPKMPAGEKRRREPRRQRNLAVAPTSWCSTNPRHEERRTVSVRATRSTSSDLRDDLALPETGFPADGSGTRQNSTYEIKLGTLWRRVREPFALHGVADSQLQASNPRWSAERAEGAGRSTRAPEWSFNRRRTAWNVPNAWPTLIVDTLPTFSWERRLRSGD